MQLVAACCKADGRLFAIGEDAGLAALRSAGQALAAEAESTESQRGRWNMLEHVGTEDGGAMGSHGEPGSRVVDVSGSDGFRAVQASFEHLSHLSMFWQVGDGLLQYWTVDATRHGFQDKVLVHIGIWMHVIYDRFRAKAWYTRKRLQLKVSKQKQ